MTISLKLNGQYLDSELVNQKYQPLVIEAIDAKTMPVIEALVSERQNLLKDLNVNLYEIMYVGYNIDEFESDNAHQSTSAPLAVISSNRSTWIRDRYDAGLLLLNGDTNFTDINDRSALVRGPVPLYCPYRLSAAEQAAKNIYMFVNVKEYPDYSRRFAGTPIKIIGWRIKSGKLECVGFGASRFAAMEFFKYIHRQYEVCSKVWLIDDNTVYINNFPGFDTVEQSLSNNTLTGLGFNGGSAAKSQLEIEAFADPRRRQFAAPVLKDPIPATILQQAVLWNVTLLTGNNTNYGPIFISSAEDGSFTRILGPAQCKYYEACTVWKAFIAKEDHDNGDNAERLDKAKKKLYAFLFENSKPLPINSGPLKDIKTLADLILKFPARIFEKEEFSLIYSKAIEQILLKAMDSGVRFPNTPFRLTKEPIIKLVNARH